MPFNFQPFQQALGASPTSPRINSEQRTAKEELLGHLDGSGAKSVKKE